MRIEEILNYFIIIMSACIIFYELFELHLMRKSFLDDSKPIPDIKEKIKLKLFSFLLLMSIIAISVMLVGCIGKIDEDPHFKVVMVDFANMGMVVLTTNLSKILNPR